MESNGGNIPSVDTNLSFFHLPFVDNANTDLVFSDRNKSQESAYDDFQNALPSHNYLGTDDVLAQILSADEPLEEPDLNGPTTLHCEICKKKFDKAKKYYGHLRVHSKDNVWVCDKCPDKKFSVKQQLMKHSLIHTPLRKIWPCPQCSMTFEALWRLQQHLFYKHLNYRTHKCDQCEKVFNKSSDLKKHMEKHSDRKRFSCPKCGAKFKLKSNMKSHLLRHDNKQTFVCSGCNRSYTQLVSLTRHMKRCPHYINRSDTNEPNTKNLCRICGLTFPYRTNLLEHCIRQHTNPPEDKKEKSNQVNVESNRTVDNIVDDILSVEADYLKMATPNEILNVYNNQNESEANADNRVQKEFLKEMNQLHILDDELFYNDLDIDCLQSNHMFNMNTNDMDYIAMDRNNEECHLTAELNDNNGIDDGIMNSLCHVKCKYLPDELLNVTEEVPSLEETHVNKVPPLSINDCSTIFESDVDLEASTNLAANLNQLIGENTVQYISTEEDDTFIISLNCGIDAEQLTGMLNIGRELVEDNRAANGIDELKTSDIPKTNIKDVECDVETIECIMKNNKRLAESTEVEDGDIIECVSEKITIKNSKRKKSIKGSKGKVGTLESAMSIDETDNNSVEHEDIIESIKIEIDNEDLKASKGGVKKSEMTNGDEKITKRVIYVCLICNKTFSKRDNYNSHCAVHEPKLRRHKCDVCGDRFSYKSTLNKHYKTQHTPCVLSHPHSCALCQRQFAAAWMLKNHEERDHKKMTPFHCDYKDCNRKFYKKFDLVVHKRYHNGERPHKCSECGLSFAHVSHLRRHARNVVCAKPAQRVNK